MLTFEWLSHLIPLLAGRRAAISRRPWCVLTSRAHRWIALASEHCDTRAAGGRAGLRRKNEDSLDQPGPGHNLPFLVYFEIYQNLADLRGAISRQPWTVLTSRTQRRIAQALGDCDTAGSGARAHLHRKKWTFLTSWAQKKSQKSQKSLYQNLTCLSTRYHFVTGWISKSKVNKKNSKKPKMVLSRFDRLIHPVPFCHRVDKQVKS